MYTWNIRTLSVRCGYNQVKSPAIWVGGAALLSVEYRARRERASEESDNRFVFLT